MIDYLGEIEFYIFVVVTGEDFAINYYWNRIYGSNIADDISLKESNNRLCY